MKKFIKKSIAGLIAGIMAISSMPFTALADEYSDFETMKSQMASFTAYSPSAHGSFSGDADYSNYSDHYKGLVYAEDVKDYSGTGSVQLGSSFTGSNSTYANVYFPTSVALYTGSNNDITVPIMISASTSRSGTWDCKFRAHSGVLSGNGLSLVNSTWNGKDEKTGSSDNCYANGSQTSNLPSLNFMSTINQTSYQLSTNATTSPTNSNIDPGYGRKAEVWANKVKVTPSFSNGSTVTTLSYNPTITFYVSSKNNGINTGKYITLNSSDSVTVVNYKVYLDKLSQVKSDVASLNATNYTKASIKAYVEACNKFLSLNPSSYSYSTNTATAVNSLVADMNSAILSYDTAKSNLVELKNYSFVNAAGTTVATVKAESVAEALNSKPENTATAYSQIADDEVNHNVTTYSWPAASEVSGTTISEVAATTTEAHDFDENGKCTKCGYQKIVIDYSAFDAAVKAAEELTNEDEKYTAASFDAYKAKVAEIKAKRDTAANQAELDALIADLANANDLLKVAAFTVKLVYVDEDGNETTADTKTVKYGETYDAVSDKNVDKWTVETDNGQTTTKLNVFDKTVSVIITKDATIKAFQTEEATEVATSKVTFVGKNNVVVAIKYVQEGGEALDTNKVSAPSVPFYSFKGWDKATVEYDGNDYTVRAVYEYAATEDDMCNVHFGEWSKKYSYDSYVYLFNANKSKKYALYSDKDCTQLLTILDGVDFYAPKTSNIYVKEYTETLAEAVIGVTGTFVETTDSAKSAVYNCKFYLPEDATAIEWGLEVTLNGKTVNVKAEKKSSRNEYSVRLNAPTTFTGEISGRAYVTYKLGDQTITKYSSAVNQTL